MQILVNELEIFLRMAQFSGEVTHAGYGSSIKLRVFSPTPLDGVSSLSDYFLLAICVCVHILGGVLRQHADVPIHEHKFWPRYMLLFQ